jgi:hypothetical protein
MTTLSTPVLSEKVFCRPVLYCTDEFVLRNGVVTGLGLSVDAAGLYIHSWAAACSCTPAYCES